MIEAFKRDVAINQDYFFRFSKDLRFLNIYNCGMMLGRTICCRLYFLVVSVDFIVCKVIPYYG